MQNVIEMLFTLNAARSLFLFIFVNSALLVDPLSGATDDGLVLTGLRLKT